MHECQRLRQLEAVERASAGRGQDAPDLALLADGLRAEREQGITIDVAYRYFATPKRRFILADTPGHVRYTRNVVIRDTHPGGLEHFAVNGIGSESTPKS